MTDLWPNDDCIEEDAEFGLLLLEAMPFLVEIGVLLDLFTGVFVMGIIIHHISREFSSIDVDRLSTLRD